MKKIWKTIFGFADDVLAYILTLLCIMFANVIPLLGSKEELVIDFSPVRVFASALVALMLTLWQEHTRPDETGSVVKSKEGRRKRFTQRMVNAMIFGFGASEIISKIFSTVNIG